MGAGVHLLGGLMKSATSCSSDEPSLCSCSAMLSRAVHQAQLRRESALVHCTRGALGFHARFSEALAWLRGLNSQFVIQLP